MDSRPTIPVEIDQNHAHVTGLQAAYIFNNSCKDYHGNFNLSLVNGTYDTGLRCDATGERADLDNTAQVVGSDIGTVVLKFTSDSVFADSASRGLFANWGGSNDEGDFFIFKNSANTLLMGFVDDTGSHRIVIGSSDLPNWQTGTQIAMQWDQSSTIYDSKNIACNVDGSYVTPGGSTSPTSWNSFTVGDIDAGNDNASGSGAFFANGVIEYLYIYNTVLSEATLADIYSSPYAMFKARPLSVYIPEKPTETPHIEIPLGHEHADGLQAAYLFNESGGKVFDWTQNQNDLSITNASWVADGLEVNANGEYLYINPINYNFTSNAGTILFCFKSSSVFEDSVDRTFFNQSGTYRIFIRKFSSNTLLFYIFDGATRYVGISNIDDYDTDFNQIAFVWDRTVDVFDAKKMGIAVNGNFIVPSASGSATSINNVDFVTNMYIGNSTVTTSPVNGIFSHTYIYNKAFSEDTLKSIYEDPYSMFQIQDPMALFSFAPVPLVIITQPQNTTVSKDTDATFFIVAIGDDQLTYQWYRNGVLQSGETSSSYTFTAGLEHNQDSVYCRITDSDETLQSSTAFVTVTSGAFLTDRNQVLVTDNMPVPSQYDQRKGLEKS